MTRSELRAQAEAAIEYLIALLDEVDGDADFEQSFPEGHHNLPLPFPIEDDEDTHDAEPLTFGRQIRSLNPTLVRPKRITMRRIA
jgi:hypothetical protein